MTQRKPTLDALLRHIAQKATDEAESLRQIQSQLRTIERLLRPISFIAITTLAITAAGGLFFLLAFGVGFVAALGW